MCKIHHDFMMSYMKQKYKEEGFFTIKISTFLNHAAVKEKQNKSLLWQDLVPAPF